LGFLLVRDLIPQKEVKQKNEEDILSMFRTYSRCPRLGGETRRYEQKNRSIGRIFPSIKFLYFFFFWFVGGGFRVVIFIGLNLGTERMVKRRVKCPHCGYEWQTGSKKNLVTCPCCLRKVRL
jgi:hypothetical protein